MHIRCKGRWSSRAGCRCDCADAHTASLQPFRPQRSRLHATPQYARSSARSLNRQVLHQAARTRCSCPRGSPGQKESKRERGENRVIARDAQTFQGFDNEVLTKCCWRERKIESIVHAQRRRASTENRGQRITSGHPHLTGPWSGQSVVAGGGKPPGASPPKTQRPGTQRIAESTRAVGSLLTRALTQGCRSSLRCVYVLLTCIQTGCDQSKLLR